MAINQKLAKEEIELLTNNKQKPIRKVINILKTKESAGIT